MLEPFFSEIFNSSMYAEALVEYVVEQMECFLTDSTRGTSRDGVILLLQPNFLLLY